MYAHIYTSVHQKNAEYASVVCFPKVRGRPVLGLVLGVIMACAWAIL